MAKNDGPDLSSAFDALLDKNWRSLDELSGRTPRAGVASMPVTLSRDIPATASARKSGRKSGRSDGIEFKFDL